MKLVRILVLTSAQSEHHEVDLSLPKWLRHALGGAKPCTSTRRHRRKKHFAIRPITNLEARTAVTVQAGNAREECCGGGVNLGR